METRLVGRTVGPTVTRFELELGPGVKVARVTCLAKDIAYAMASPDVRILAPIPGKSAIGVEVPEPPTASWSPSATCSPRPRRMHATHPLEVALGRDIAGRAVMANLADMPHILISGATGSGKSSCINSLITSILMRATPEEVRLILVDPEAGRARPVQRAAAPADPGGGGPEEGGQRCSWAVTEMERRYDLLAEVGMRDITGYNEAVAPATSVLEPERGLAGLAAPERRGPTRTPPSSRATWRRRRGARRRRAVGARSLPPRVVDELNDLMMVGRPRRGGVGVPASRRWPRAVGIHLVLATQRPSVDVITGVIKANVPSASRLLGVLAGRQPGHPRPARCRAAGGQGRHVAAHRVLVGAPRIQGPVGHRGGGPGGGRPLAPPAPADGRGSPAPTGRGRGRRAGVEDDDDELLPTAMELVVRSQLGSTSMLQRKLRVGFSRAGRLMDLLGAARRGRAFGGLDCAER